MIYYGPYCPKCGEKLETIDGEWFNCPKRCEGCIGLVAEEGMYLQPVPKPQKTKGIRHLTKQ